MRCCSGLLCIYLATFLYETQEGKVQNLLEDLWVRIEDLKLAALSRQTAFVRVVAERYGVRISAIVWRTVDVLAIVGSVRLLLDCITMIRSDRI